MQIYHTEYNLHDGYVHNWLVAGPYAVEVTELDRFRDRDLKTAIARHYYDKESGVKTPVENARFEIDNQQLTWHWYRCRDDHFVDRTSFYPTCHYLRTWAYTRLRLPSARQVTMTLTTNGPADLWVNGGWIHRQEHFDQIPHSVSFPVEMEGGDNEILVRFEEVATRECPYAMALHLTPADDALVLVPTRNEAIARRLVLERAFDQAYLDRDVYGPDDTVAVNWDRDMVGACSLTVRLQDARGSIYAEARPTVRAGTVVKIARSYHIPDGSYAVTLMPSLEEYYFKNMRTRRHIPLNVLNSTYSSAPYGTYQERRREALEDAARREVNVFSEIARLVLGERPDKEVIMETVERINRRGDCSDFYLVGLLGMMHRHSKDVLVPREVRKPLEECILNFRYWMDEPGDDAMCFWSENHQILFHTCEILAGQLYPERVFTNNGQDGRWHREKGERMALSWLLKRGQGGFREWDSNCYFEQDILALSHLADLAENTAVAELAAVVLDKMLFTIAINSFRGTFGSTHGRTYTPLIKGSRLEATAGISRLMWGMGAFNHHVMGTVSLACANYELPPIVPDIAAAQPEEFWNRERHAGKLEEWCDLASGEWEVNKVTYKTPDYMLASAQDYRPGAPGTQEHIWQATLSHDAVVFVTHPPCMSEKGAHRPNFWHGNVRLPRVAQWKDVLIAIHRLPANDWLGFTHAYFPIAAFDEHVIRGRWAFARVGEGYLALTAAQGLTPITRGDNAYRELRSYGQDNVWLCHMGRAAQDGSFAGFQEKMLNLEMTFNGTSVQCTTLRGDHLAFAWEGPLTLNGREQPITGFRHYENDYCTADLPAEKMEIRFGDYLLRLHFTP